MRNVLSPLWILAAAALGFSGPALAEALRLKREGNVDASSWIRIKDDQGQQFASLIEIGADRLA